MSTITIDNAVKLAKIMARIKAQVPRGNNFGTSSELVEEIVKLRLPANYATPLLDEIERRCGFGARQHYQYMANFHPVPQIQQAPAAIAPDTGPDYDDETGEGCVRFQGIDLATAMHGPVLPRSAEELAEGERKLKTTGRGMLTDPRRVRGFPFAQVFGKLKVADRTRTDYKTKQEVPDGIYIKPWHKPVPGAHYAHCCFAVDLPDVTAWNTHGTEEMGLGCELMYDDDAKPIDGWYGTHNNALQLLKYLESGLICMDDIAPFCYTSGSIEEAIPDPPDGVYPDDSLGLWILDEVEPVRVCNKAYPIAEVVDECGKPHGRQIRYWNGESWRLYTVTKRALEGEGASMFQDLSDNGLTVSNLPVARSAFREVIKAPKINKTVTQYSRPGWHGHRFVLPTGYSLSAKEIGASKVLVARAAATLDQTQGGSLEGWREGVACEIWKGDCPQFAMGQLAGMCGVLTSLLMLDHPVVHFSGPPASGKSTAQYIAAGLVANPAPGQGTLVELQQDVEAVLPKGLATAAHIDDPTKHGSPTTVERLMYRAMSCCPFTVSSVASLEQIVERAGGKMDEGIRRRVLTVDTRKAPRIDPWRAADIKAAAQSNYGHAAPCFLDHLLTKGGTLDRDKLLKEVRDNARDFLGVLVLADGETVSAATHVGLLQLVGELMQEAGLIPGNADVIGLLKSVWADWLERRSATPVNRAIAELDAALADAGDLGSDPAAWCWVKDGVGYIPTNTLAEIIGEEIKAATVMRHLSDCGRLIPAAGRNLAHSRLPDRTQCQHYRVKVPATIAIKA